MQDESKWREFANAFGEFLGITKPGSLPVCDLIALRHYKVKDTPIPLQFSCLKMLLAESTPGVEDQQVKIYRFGAVVDWFGPINNQDRMAFLDNMSSVLECSWFHGDLLTEEAQHRLTGKPAGTFLVRFSNNAVGSYVISKGMMATHGRN